MNGLVKEETCQERKASCDRLHQEAYFGPVTQALGEIAETVKRDREEFWKAINGHSHEGLDPTSRVIRK